MQRRKSSRLHDMLFTRCYSLDPCYTWHTQFLLKLLHTHTCLLLIRVDDQGYSAPSWIRALATGFCLTAGFGISLAFSLGLGDPTWSVSSGLGACAAAGVYEVGRPKRLSVSEAKELEGQWQDFEGFADQRLQRTGRCHESEIYAAFRRAFPKYRWGSDCCKNGGVSIPYIIHAIEIHLKSCLSSFGLMAGVKR